MTVFIIPCLHSIFSVGTTTYSRGFQLVRRLENTMASQVYTLKIFLEINLRCRPFVFIIDFTTSVFRRSTYVQGLLAPILELIIFFRAFFEVNLWRASFYFVDLFNFNNLYSQMNERYNSSKKVKSIQLCWECTALCAVKTGSWGNRYAFSSSELCLAFYFVFLSQISLFITS